MITVEKRIHRGWKELNKVKNLSIKSIVGKYQYIYSNDYGEISLVELPDYLGDGVTLWEIYSLKGNLFDDVERFHSKEQAIIAIENYLVHPILRKMLNVSNLK